MSPRIYFDNAATTPIDPRVIDQMVETLNVISGNPSSVHKEGREAKVTIEKARTKVASLIGASPAEVFFTSGATEAINTAIIGGALGKKFNRIVTSPIEHHAVLHASEFALKQGYIEQLSYIDIDEKGRHDLDSLERLVKEHPNTLICLMHGNNEIGNLAKTNAIFKIKEQHGAYLLTDTVQTMGKYNIDVTTLGADYIVGSAHKFHGPKGVGFLYSKSGKAPIPLIYGGPQERNMRGGTENIASIVGMATALQIAIEEQENNFELLTKLKSYFINTLTNLFPDARFNGLSGDLSGSLPHIVNFRPPKSDINDMILFHLDINGVAVSSGSACTSGSVKASHVLEALNFSLDSGSVRVSFSKYNTLNEIDEFFKILSKIYAKHG